TQPVGERNSELAGAFETAVGRGVLALGEDGFDRGFLEVGVELSTRRADDAVTRPRRQKVGTVGEMAARVDVKVLGGHDVVVPGACEVVVDVPRDACTAGDLQGATLTEIVLDVSDDERLHQPTVANPAWLWISATRAS